MCDVRMTALVVAAAVALTTGAAPAAQSAEELASRQYQSGLGFLRDQKFGEAMRDFQAVVDAYPTTAVADDALLQIARYELATRNIDGAQAAVDLLTRKYGTSDSAPFGLVIAGQIALRRGRATEDIERALAEFQRVPQLHPGTEAVPEAMVARASTLRLAGRCGDAIEQYEQVTVEYPRSVWAPQANVGVSRCLVAQNRPFDAMAGLQRAIRNPLAGDEAALARSLNTVLYRLYLKPPQPSFAFTSVSYAGSAGRLRDVRALALQGASLVAVGDNGAVFLDTANKGAVTRTARIEKARGAFVDAEGQLTLFGQNGLLRDEKVVPLTVPKPDRTPRLLEAITAAGALSNGDLIVADNDGQIVHRFRRDLQVIGPFAKGRVDRLAVGTLDQVALLDRNSKAVTLLSFDGRPLAAIPQKGTGWLLDEPVDVAFDVFDHLYVLDRGTATVFVFAVTPSLRLLTSFTLAERAPGAFRRATSMALDAAGRLYIFDERAERVQVYR